MEETKIIEEGMETVTEELTNPAMDAINDLPTIVEGSGNGDIHVLPVAIGIAIGGAIVLGVKKIYKMIKAKKKYVTPETHEESAEDTEIIDDDEEEE